MFEHHEIPLIEEIDAHAPRRRGSPERSVQVTLKRYLERVLPGCEVVAIRNEAQPRSNHPGARARFHEARRAMGGKWGAPDLMVLQLERVFFVECKAPGGVLSDRQRELHLRWAALGHRVIVADGIESLRLGLRLACIATREAPGQPMREARVRKQRRSKLAADAIPFVLALMLAMPALAQPPLQAATTLRP